MDDVLISRAAAVEALSTPCDKRYRHGVWETCLGNIETAIGNIPAVDAAPVVHASPLWIKPWEPDAKICTWKCGYLCSAWREYVSKSWEYCPHCGAKMDGRVANG